MNTKNATSLTLTLVLVAVAGLRADITIVNPALANHTPSIICPADDGANVLDPDPVEHLPPPEAGKGGVWRSWTTRTILHSQVGPLNLAPP